MKFYCRSLINYKRWSTRVVRVGDIEIGGDNPIRIQSMTTTDTMDTNATINQSIRMIEAGCEIVRITAPSNRDAENLKNIKEGLLKKGYKTPIVADIHFTPSAAEIAAKIVEKVRINPGNYVDRKKFKTYDYSEDSYKKEIDRIREKFLPLIKICKEYKTALRIGTNHGSLSDRIMSHYGDTPHGMVESAMEFLRIANEANFHDIVLSMKASNTHVMVQAYRLLVKSMVEENMNYPLHLGVTEAGEAEDGRIKSAVGIGSLLEDGLGDTIRVSLTEEPEFEIPVCKMILEKYNINSDSRLDDPEIKTIEYDPFFYKKRRTNKILNIGAEEVPIVIGDLSKFNEIKYSDLGQFGYLYSAKSDKWHISDLAVDFLFIGQNTINFEIPGTLKIIYKNSSLKKENYYKLYSYNEVSQINPKIVSFLECSLKDDFYDKIVDLPNCIVVLSSSSEQNLAQQRKVFIDCLKLKIENPIIIRRNYGSMGNDKFLLKSATDIGGLQIDGFGDGIWFDRLNNLNFTNETAFGILQASRTRISKTEYISCPSCGRTLFDLQETTAKIRSKTSHLKGLKIGIMGCIVNGPGEMADADYGYVGTGTGKISLYKGQEVVEKHIDSDKAVNALIKLIKDNSDWVEP
ncbi:MAG: (E)-4-hydroxy-3-methylbut-2-enyl-diphosphate synthase [Candidatus Marinimicrobia bacterium]|nr:(E)-4-hydroxy-3-methylbut-2-enyl-diphosphate synthase [Candidatus Neomarinimicrobiota bacterium]